MAEAAISWNEHFSKKKGMEDLTSLGLVVLDDTRVRVRTADGALQTLSDMIASSEPTNIQVQALIATAISNRVDGAPEALNTLAELSESLNDNDSAYATLLALIQQNSRCSQPHHLRILPI